MKSLLESYYSALGENPLDPEEMGDEMPDAIPEPDLEPDLDLDTSEPDDFLQHQSRAKAGLIRTYRALGEERVSPVMVLKGLEKISAGEIPMGPQVTTLSPLTRGLVKIFEDPALVSILIRLIDKSQGR